MNQNWDTFWDTNKGTIISEYIIFIIIASIIYAMSFFKSWRIQVQETEKVDGKVIPLSLQALVENAIKHNEISKANPLNIVIAITDDHELIVENNIQTKNVLGENSKTGLKNLAGRYEFLTGKKMIITKNENYFRVSLPLIILNN